MSWALPFGTVWKGIFPVWSAAKADQKVKHSKKGKIFSRKIAQFTGHNFRSTRPSACKFPASPHALDEVEKRGNLCNLQHVIVQAIIICYTKKAPRADSNANSMEKKKKKHAKTVFAESLSNSKRKQHLEYCTFYKQVEGLESMSHRMDSKRDQRQAEGCLCRTSFAVWMMSPPLNQKMKAALNRDRPTTRVQERKPRIAPKTAERSTRPFGSSIIDISDDGSLLRVSLFSLCVNYFPTLFPALSCASA